MTQNVDEANKWFRKAAEQEHPKGRYRIGYMYRFGKGVTEDF